jgi:hypothetical protein
MVFLGQDLNWAWIWAGVELGRSGTARPESKASIWCNWASLVQLVWDELERIELVQRVGSLVELV